MVFCCYLQSHAPPNWFDETVKNPMNKYKNQGQFLILSLGWQTSVHQSLSCWLASNLFSSLFFWGSTDRLRCISNVYSFADRHNGGEEATRTLFDLFTRLIRRCTGWQNCTGQSAADGQVLRGKLWLQQWIRLLGRMLIVPDQFSGTQMSAES